MQAASRATFESLALHAILLQRECVQLLQAKPTDARFTLRDPLEVMTFLERLVSWGSSSANGWHAARGCNGWKLTADGAARPSPLPSLTEAASAEADAVAEAAAGEGSAPYAQGELHASGDSSRAPAAGLHRSSLTAAISVPQTAAAHADRSGGESAGGLPGRLSLPRLRTPAAEDVCEAGEAAVPRTPPRDEVAAELARLAVSPFAGNDTLEDAWRVAAPPNEQLDAVAGSRSGGATGFL